MNIEAREADFWSHVDRPGVTQCWEWTGSRWNGYGMTCTLTEPRRRLRAYTLAYLLARGALPAGLELDHLCRNRACCNPFHLEAVTHAVNSRRSNNACGANARKTHCIHGHAFTPENTQVTISASGHPHRRCRACAHATSAAASARKRLGIGRGGRQAAQTHCIHGHAFTPENTRIASDGCRRCRECERLRDRRRAAKH